LHYFDERKVFRRIGINVCIVDSPQASGHGKANGFVHESSVVSIESLEDISNSVG
jgi:hypothetical protein